MTEEELDAALYTVTGIIPLIVVGPGHNIARFTRYGDPKEAHYRGVPVVVHDGWGERCEIIPMTGLADL